MGPKNVLSNFLQLVSEKNCSSSSSTKTLQKRPKQSRLMSFGYIDSNCIGKSLINRQSWQTKKEAANSWKLEEEEQKMFSSLKKRRKLVREEQKSNRYCKHLEYIGYYTRVLGVLYFMPCWIRLFGNMHIAQIYSLYAVHNRAKRRNIWLGKGSRELA